MAMTFLNLPPNSVAGPFSGDKILAHAEHLAALMRGEVPPPIVVELDLTNRCQLDCGFCTNAAHRKEKPVWLEFRTAACILADMSQLGVKAVTFTGGGEPLLHPDADRLIGAARHLGMDVALITNGMLLDRVDLRALVDRCTWIRVSVDAHNRESYYVSKKVDAWERVEANIGLLVDAKREYKSDCTIGLGYLTDAERAEGFVAFASHFQRSGVDYVQARPITYMPGDERASLQKDVELLREDRIDITALGEAEPRFLSVPSILGRARQYQHDGYRVLASTPKYTGMGQPRGYDHCTGVYFACVVGATGDVWPCCHLRGEQWSSLGNIHERLLSEIWADVETRNRVYGQIDVKRCMPLCRFHRTNQLLAGVNWRPEHPAFL